MYTYSRIDVIDGKQYMCETGFHTDIFNPMRVFSLRKRRVVNLRFGSWVKMSKKNEEGEWLEILTMKR